MKQILTIELFSRKHKKHALPLFEIARVLVRFNHVANVIVNSNHSVV